MGWINVKDKLPEEGRPVLVWNKDSVEIGFLHNKEWRNYVEVFHPVAHWMPLPQRPQGSEE